MVTESSGMAMPAGFILRLVRAWGPTICGPICPGWAEKGVRPSMECFGLCGRWASCYVYIVNRTTKSRVPRGRRPACPGTLIPM